MNITIDLSQPIIIQLPDWTPYLLVGLALAMVIWLIYKIFYPDFGYGDY